MRNMKHKNITRLKNYKPTSPSLRSRIIPDLSYLDNLLPEKTLSFNKKIGIANTDNDKLTESPIKNTIDYYFEKIYHGVFVEIKNNKVKLGIGIAKGKKKYDKRQSEKKKDWSIQKNRLTKKILKDN